MRRTLVAVWLIGALTLAPSGLVFPQVSADPQLDEGIRQAQIGDFEKAIVTLDAVARRLGAEGGRSRDLARAYVYLSIAYLGLSQEQKAKAQFLEALKTDDQMQLDEGEFPPKILQFFEEAKEEAVAAGVVKPTPAPEPTAAASGPAPVPPEPAKKKGSKTLPILLGVGAAGGVGIALAAGGGGDGGGGSTPNPPPAPVEQVVEAFSSDVPRAIPDLGTAVSQLSFPQSGTILEATLEFRIRHSCRGDLRLELRHPDGTTYTAGAPSDCADIWEGPLAVPAETKQSGGTWTLTASDQRAEDEGVLEVWGLRLRIRR